MLLKKHYDKASLKTDKPIVTHLEVIRCGDKWHPSTRIMERGQAEGWLIREGNMLALKTKPGTPNVKFKIVAPPGIYCCHCGEPCSSSLAAQGHLVAKHKGKESPSKQNPAGYAQHNFYMTDRVKG